MHNRTWGNRMDMDTMRHFYNEVYYRDAPLPGTISRHYRRLALCMDVSGGHRVLDVGCGTAEWLRAIHDQGAIPVGIDLSRRAISIGRTSLHEGTLLVGCAENLPFGTGQFDLVTCLGSLEHFMDMKQALLEMVRVARDDANILILVPNAGFLTRRLGFYRGTIQSDIREVTMTIDQWKKVFEETGLHVKKRWRDLHILSWRWISLSKAWHIPLRALQAAALIFWPLRWQFQVYHLCGKKRLSGAE